ncbi:MAG: hypothetical protein K5682_06675 [Lachnospiraceae bacterium]|nr:hypothetical protein [Lachnospiraceae bacterium]
MDLYNHDVYSNYDSHFRFARMAKVLGLISILTAISLQPVLPMVFGGMAIIFGILSKGVNRHYRDGAKGAMICGGIAIVIHLAIYITAIYLILNVPSYHQMFMEMFEQRYGMPFDQFIQQVYGGSI